jgi:hypothetical protein
LKVAALFLGLWMGGSASLFAQLADLPFQYHQADSVAALYPHHSLSDLRLLAHKLTASLADSVVKFRAIYTWVCSNIQNDYHNFKVNESKREKFADDPEKLRLWNKKFSKQVVLTLVSKHKTICTGYAYLIRELSLHAGLPCEIINGYGRTSQSNIGGKGVANHSWNAVHLKGKWYLCDATWSSGVVDSYDGNFIKKYTDAYFLPKAELFAKNHYPLDTAWLLLKEHPTLQNFLDAPLAYHALFKYGIGKIYPEKFSLEAQKNTLLTFSFCIPPGIYPSIEIQVIQSNHVLNTLSVTPANGMVQFEYDFTSKGLYIIHILFNKEAVLSYQVRIK